MENQIALYHERVEGIDRKKQYRLMALLTFCVAVALPLVRLLSYYLPIENELLSDLAFTLPMQIGVMVVMPVLFYKFAFKQNVRGMLAFSGFHRTKWYNLLLAVPIGICCHVVTIGVSNLWQSMLIALGYTHGSSSMPETFSAGALILSLFLTGVLPGFCEEFFNRGGLLTTLRGSFPLRITMVLMGIEFGLFHQNITQVFYTALFGALMAFLTLKLKSIYPAMIVHFVNNSVSVVNDYCDEYGFFGGGFYKVYRIFKSAGILDTIQARHFGISFCKGPNNFILCSLIFVGVKRKIHTERLAAYYKFCELSSARIYAVIVPRNSAPGLFVT